MKRWTMGLAALVLTASAAQAEAFSKIIAFGVLVQRVLTRESTEGQAPNVGYS
jgi:hypothetical protein